jgi:hypothetical protein
LLRDAVAVLRNGSTFEANEVFEIDGIFVTGCSFETEDVFEKRASLRGNCLGQNESLGRRRLVQR